MEGAKGVIIMLVLVVIVIIRVIVVIVVKIATLSGRILRITISIIGNYRTAIVAKFVVFIASEVMTDNINCRNETRRPFNQFRSNFLLSLNFKLNYLFSSVTINSSLSTSWRRQHPKHSGRRCQSGARWPDQSPSGWQA